MGIRIDDKLYFNLEEQVQYLTKYHELNKGLVEWGIQVVGQVEKPEDLPIPYNGAYGDAIAVGTKAPFFFYIWTRATIEGDPAYWFPYGEISIVGPPGPKGETGNKGDPGESSKWYISASINAGNTFKDGDMLLISTNTTDNGNVYRYSESNRGWIYGGNISGPQGIPGQEGKQGPRGPQGPQGEKGETGDVGGFINIVGIINNVDQLPTPESVGNTTVAYLVGASEPYDLYIQVGTSPETAVWNNVGAFNAATLVMVNGVGQNVWNADTKLDKTGGTLTGRLITKDGVTFTSNVGSGVKTDEYGNFYPADNSSASWNVFQGNDSSSINLLAVDFKTGKVKANSSEVLTYANAERIGANVKGAKQVNNLFAERPTSANLPVVGDGSLKKFLATSKMIEGHPIAYGSETTGTGSGHIIHCEWDNPYGYSSQIFVGNGPEDSMQYRTMNSGEWFPWRRIIDNININQYALPLTGGTIYNSTSTTDAPLKIRTKAESCYLGYFNEYNEPRGYIGFGSTGLPEVAISYDNSEVDSGIYGLIHTGNIDKYTSTKAAISNYTQYPIGTLITALSSSIYNIGDNAFIYKHNSDEIAYTASQPGTTELPGTWRNCGLASPPYTGGDRVYLFQRIA